MEQIEKQLDSLRREIREGREEVKQLHDCLDGMRDEQQELKHGMSTYFLGVQPETHVRHHNRLTDKIDDNKDFRRISRETLGVIAAALIINVFGYIYVATGIEKKLANQNTEQQVKK